MIYLLVGVVLAALWLLWRAIKGHSEPIFDVKELAGRIRPVDLSAFRNLLSEEDERFLRAKIPPKEFRSYQRLRTRAAIEYLQLTAQNAAVLLRLGEGAAKSDIAEVATRGRELADLALSVRANCLIAMLKVYADLIFPIPFFNAGAAFEKYARMHESAMLLAIAQHPDSSTSSRLTVG